MTRDNLKSRNKYGVLAGLVGIISNLILGIIKLIIGFISKSISITIDAVNNLSDMVSSILTLFGFIMVKKKPNKIHPYGYARYEYVTGFVISLFMLLTGILFTKESIEKIIYKKELLINKTVYIVLIISIIIKYIQMKIYKYYKNKIDSSTLKASCIDTRNDIITTTSILLSLIVMEKFKINIDGYIGVIISIFIVIISIKTINETLEPIIGIIPSKEKVKTITDKLKSYDFVLGIHDLVIHNYGVNHDFVTVHVEIDSKMDMISAHDLIDNIENDFKELYNTDLTIHIDPIITGDEEVNKLKKIVLNTLKKLNKDLLIHDFRVISGNTHKNILFDCVVPHELPYTKEDIVAYLINNIDAKDIKYYFIVEIDRPYC